MLLMTLNAWTRKKQRMTNTANNTNIPSIPRPIRTNAFGYKISKRNLKIHKELVIMPKYSGNLEENEVNKTRQTGMTDNFDGIRAK
jgi:hypothetical protein